MVGAERGHAKWVFSPFWKEEKALKAVLGIILKSRFVEACRISGVSEGVYGRLSRLPTTRNHVSVDAGECCRGYV